MNKTYTVRTEVLIKSCDFQTFTVQASSREQAKQLAIAAYHNSEEPDDVWASDWLDSEIDLTTRDSWDVREQQ